MKPKRMTNISITQELLEQRFPSMSNEDIIKLHKFMQDLENQIIEAFMIPCYDNNTELKTGGSIVNTDNV